MLVSPLNDITIITELYEICYIHQASFDFTGRVNRIPFEGRLEFPGAL